MSSMQQEALSQDTALRLLLEQVKRLYRSSHGRELTAQDWLTFQRTVEDFNCASGFTLLGPPGARTLPILFEPASVLFERIDPARSAAHRRARTILQDYEFIFQIVRHGRLPKTGEKLMSIIAETAAELGLTPGMDLSPFEHELNAFAQPDFQFLGDPSYSRDADLFFCEGKDTLSMKLQDSHKIRAHFTHKEWRVCLLGVDCSTELKCEVRDELARLLFEVWKREPEQLKQPPLQWVIHTRIDGQGWTTVDSWVAPNCAPPPTEVR
ncbi:hypothetical protein [Pyxidicoccus trucidator]|uniref:hypothetical protein n=1 Tax=Pyxidicoccus trucidator TaxID=2709662 RepID=UPI0013DA2479|nr:hypothetical protein [Pyxidicoccus trucidator]